MDYYHLLVADPAKECDLRLLIQVPIHTPSIELFHLIRKACAFGENMIASFLLCDNGGHTYLTLLPDELFLDESPSGQQELMDQYTVEDIIIAQKENNLRCFFIYDFFKEKGLELTLLDIISEEKVEQPGTAIVVKGTPPATTECSTMDDDFIFQDIEQEEYLIKDFDLEEDFCFDNEDIMEDEQYIDEEDY